VTARLTISWDRRCNWRGKPSALKNFFQKKHSRGKYSKHYSSRDFNSEINIFNRQKGENKYKKHRSKGDIPQLDGQFTHNQLKQLSRLYS
jgi:hypothetical protein